MANEKTSSSADATTQTAPAAGEVAPTTSTSAPTVEVTEFEQTLEEFCAAFSNTERRVELLSAFYVGEKKAGKVKDLPSAYRKRFDEFVKAVPKRGKKA